MKDYKLYVILDKELAGKKDILKIAKDALRGGADIVQLRDKISSDSTLIKKAKALRDLVKRYKKLFIINDRADIARIVNADGVHLGQEDTPIKYARKILPRKIIGVSTHNLAQAIKAQKNGADYIGIGPVFRTTGKPGLKPIGIEVLKTVKRNINIPFFAIGGINLHNAGRLNDLGINKIAVISAVMNAKDVRTSALLLKRELGKRLK